MTTHPSDQLSTVESKGRRMPLVYADPDTQAPRVHDRESRPCPGCGELTSEAEFITKLFRVWWHEKCAQAYLRTEGEEETWLVLGRQLADRPSMFKTTQTRAIVEQLLRIATDRLEPTRSDSARKHLS